MTDARPFSELMAVWPAERRAKIEKRVQRALKAMRLKEIREAQQLSQVALAKKLRVAQPAVAKLEQRADMYLSTLRDYIKATGGKLRLIAEYPQTSIEIRSLHKP